MNETHPLRMLEMQMAHQTPSIPHPIAPRIMAKGMRNALKVILVTAGGTVRPTP